MTTKTVVGGIVAGAVLGALTSTLVLSSMQRRTVPHEVADLQEEVSELRARLAMLDPSPASPSLMSDAREEPSGGADQGARIDALALELQKLRVELAMRSIAGVHPEPATKEPTAKERASFGDLDTQRLLAEVRKMVSKRTPPIDSEGIIAATDVLLSRGLDPDERAETLIMRGVGLRGRGDTEVVRAAFNEAIQIAGPDSERGREARVQVAWTDANDKRPLDSAEGFLEVANHPSSNEMQRAWNRYHAGVQFEKAGLPQRAVGAYQRIVDDHGSSEDLGSMRVVGMARASIQRLGAGK